MIINETKRAELKERIERVLSEILSDKHDCVVRLKFEPVAKEEKRTT